MRTSVRGIIPYENGLILVHRIKKEEQTIKDYYVFPGGGLEENETAEECLFREIKEELGIVVRIKKKLYESANLDRKELFFLCEYISGKPGTGIGPEFTSNAYKDRGKYIIETIPMEELAHINLLPSTICEKWINDYRTYTNVK